MLGFILRNLRVQSFSSNGQRLGNLYIDADYNNADVFFHHFRLHLAVENMLRTLVLRVIWTS